MSRLGNHTMPMLLAAPAAVHEWGAIADHVGAVTMLHLLEAQLEEQAKARGAVLATPPVYETYRLGDPHVPATVTAGLRSVGMPDGVVLVHAFAITQQRNAVLGLRAARPSDAAASADAGP